MGRTGPSAACDQGTGTAAPPEGGDGPLPRALVTIAFLAMRLLNTVPVPPFWNLPSQWLGAASAIRSQAVPLPRLCFPAPAPPLPLHQVSLNRRIGGLRTCCRASVGKALAYRFRMVVLQSKAISKGGMEGRERWRLRMEDRHETAASLSVPRVPPLPCWAAHPRRGSTWTASRGWSPPPSRCPPPRRGGANNIEQKDLFVFEANINKCSGLSPIISPKVCCFVRTSGLWHTI